jgi:CHRD domain-containing protein
MKRSLWLALAVFLCLAGTARAQVSTYTALLTGGNETPNTADPDGVGFAVVTVDQGAGTVSFAAYALNIVAPTASHIHKGAAGTTGAVVIPFTPPNSFVNGFASGTVNGVAAALLADLVRNPPGYYFNIHNADFPGGAVRGQLRPAPGTTAPTVLYLPVTIKVTGARGENFVEDVRIVNRGAAAADVVIDFFASNAAGLAGPTSTKNVNVAPGQQLVLNDILGSTFGTSGIGALRFTSDKEVIVEARILDDKRPAGGQLGFFIHGLPIEAPCRFGTLPVLSQASAAETSSGIGLRTNIGYFNPNPVPVTVTFTARKTSDGSNLGAPVPVTVQPFSHAQSPVFTLINSVAAADQKQDDFYVSSSVTASANTTSGGPLFVYFAVGDNFTGDSYYSAAVCPP